MKKIKLFFMLLTLMIAFANSDVFADSLESQFKSIIKQFSNKMPDLIRLPYENVSENERSETLEWERKNYKKWASQLEIAISQSKSDSWVDDAAYLLVYFKKSLSGLKNEYLQIDTSYEISLLKELIDKYPFFSIEKWSINNLYAIYADFGNPEIPDIVKLHLDIFAIYFGSRDWEKTKEFGEMAIKKYPNYAYKFEKVLNAINKMPSSK